jgi:hypothetical protein
MAAGEAPPRFNNRDAAYLVAGGANASAPDAYFQRAAYMVPSS